VEKTDIEDVRILKFQGKKGKGKDIDLYCASHAPGTPNAHLRH